MQRQSTGNSNSTSLKSLGIERYEVVEVERRQLKNAPYNPRRISDDQREKLEAALRKQGLVVPPTWNERTGNIVGGHQRISILDTIAGTKNYTLSVAKIDVDEKQEKEINILLNNDAAQGDWDLDKLFPLVKDDGLDLIGMGFNAKDMVDFFGQNISGDVLGADALSELAEKVRSFRDSYNENVYSRDGGMRAISTEFYLVIIFEDANDCGKFLTEAGWPDNRYHSGKDLRQLLKGARHAGGSQHPAASSAQED